MNQDLPWLEEELAAHSQWVRRLARSLVHDEFAAEDLVQDTWVAALRRPPADRRALRSWLARVVRTLAWKQQRRASAAPASGLGDELQGGTPGPDLVERLELHRLLADELRALREPLRTTLLQRFFEDLSAAQIAQRAGIPAPTVRWRLQQGLEELRARLDARFGGRRDTWMSALAFALPAKGAVLGGSGIAIGEGMLMTTLMKVSLGAAVLVIGALLVQPLLTTDEAPLRGISKSEASGSALEAPAEATGAPHESLAAEPAEPARAGLPADSRSSAVNQPEGEARVVAHIVDEQLRPIAGAWMCTVDNTRQSRRVRREEAVISGVDGIATLVAGRELYDFPQRFAVGAAGCAMVFPTGIPKLGAALHLGDIVLHPGGSIRGRVVDSKQQGVANAEVVAWDLVPSSGAQNGVEPLKFHEPGMVDSVPETRSTDDGSFLVDNVSSGMTRIWARLGSRSWTLSAPIEVRAGVEVRDVVLVVDSGDGTDPELRDVEGVVLDPDGKPLFDARIQVYQRHENGSWTGNEFTRSDGRFRIHPRARGVSISLDIKDTDERYTHATLEDVKAGTHDLVVRLEQPKTLLLSVRDEHGPIERFRVNWDDHERVGDLWFADEDEPHAGGSALVRVLGSPCYLQVVAPGHAPARLGPIDGKSPPAELAVTLRSAPGIHGRVLADGKPVAGARLLLHELPGINEIKVDGFTSLVNQNVQAKAVTDSEGRFALELPRDGRFMLFTDAEGYARAQHGPVPLQAQCGLPDLEISLDAGGTLEGKVLVPPGRSPAGVVVGINHGDARPLTQTVGPEGTFRFEHLGAGWWEIQRAERESSRAMTTISFGGGQPEKAALRHDFSIAVGETTRRDLDLRDAGPCVVEIALTNNSQPAGAWSIVARAKGQPAYSRSGSGATSDSGGRARLELRDPGEYTLTIAPPPESRSAFQSEWDLTLQRGPNGWNQDIRTGRLEGKVSGWQPDAGLEWRLRVAGAVYQQPLRLDGAGHFAEAFSPVGQLEIRRGKSGGYDPNPETVQRIELAAGETKVLQLR